MSTGRPTKLTPVVQEQIVASIRNGAYLTVAAQAVGIHPSTLRRWLARGRDERARLEANPRARPRASEQPFLDLLEMVEQAQATAEVTAIGIIREAAEAGNWQAAAWWLERTRPERFGRRERISTTVREEAERLAAAYGLDVAEVLAEAERILRGRG